MQEKTFEVVRRRDPGTFWMQELIMEAPVEQAGIVRGLRPGRKLDCDCERVRGMRAKVVVIRVLGRCILGGGCRIGRSFWWPV